jgi:hypothetical protein
VDLLTLFRFMNKNCIRLTLCIADRSGICNEGDIFKCPGILPEFQAECLSIIRVDSFTWGDDKKICDEHRSQPRFKDIRP